MKVEIKVVKEPAISKGIDPKPFIEEALEYVGSRMDTKGSGAGERNNEQHRQRQQLAQRIDYTKGHHPRHTGFAKQHKTMDLGKEAAPQALENLSNSIGRKWVG